MVITLWDALQVYVIKSWIIVECSLILFQSEHSRSLSIRFIEGIIGLHNIPNICR